MTTGPGSIVVGTWAGRRPGQVVVDAGVAAAFAHDGAVRVAGLLGPARVAAWLAVWPALVDASRALRLPDAQGRPVELLLARGLATGPLAELVADPALVGTAAELLGVPVVPHQVVASPKPPGAGRVEWHQEYRSLHAYGLRRADVVLAMVALDAAPVEAGCLQVAVASHRLGLLPHRRRCGQEVACELALADRPRRVLPARPGDVIFFHALTAHASDPNATTRPRRAVAVCYRAVYRLVGPHR